MPVTPGVRGRDSAVEMATAGVQRPPPPPPRHPEAPLVPDHLKCPLTKELYVDPVATRCGHTFSRAAFLRHFDACGFCPECHKKSCGSEQLNPVLNLVVQVKAYQKKTGGGPEEFVVHFIGRTGVGKSRTLFNLTRQPEFTWGEGHSSHTKRVCGKITTFTGDEIVRVFDTPGTEDTFESLQAILDIVAEGICCAPKVNAFVVCLRFGREITDGEVRAIRHIAEYLGMNVLSYVMFIVTKTDSDQYARTEDDIEEYKKRLLDRLMDSNAQAGKQKLSLGQLRYAVKRCIFVENQHTDGQPTERNQLRQVETQPSTWKYGDFVNIRLQILQQLRDLRDERNVWEADDSEVLSTKLKKKADGLLEGFKASVQQEVSHKHCDEDMLASWRRYFQHVREHGYRVPETEDELPFSFVRKLRETNQYGAFVNEWVAKRRLQQYADQFLSEIPRPEDASKRRVDCVAALRLAAPWCAVVAIGIRSAIFMFSQYK